MKTTKCNFAVSYALTESGAIDREATIKAFTDNLDTEIDNRETGVARVRQYAEEIFEQNGNPERLPKGIVQNGVMERMGADISNWGTVSKLVSDGLSHCLTGSVAGSKLVSFEEATAKRLARAEKREATKAAKLAKASA